MSKFNYNKQRHLELLKLKYSQEKVLTSIEKSELNEYSSLLDNTLDWETKEQYIDLLEKLISREINSFKFYIKFKERNDSNGEFTKIRRGTFIGEIIVAEEIYQYRYPYYLPESILFLPTYNDYYRNSMVKIKLLFIESYSSSAVEKRMQIKAFLSQFRRSNQKIAKIKKEILIIFNDLQKKDLIDSRFKLISETEKHRLKRILFTYENFLKKAI